MRRAAYPKALGANGANVPRRLSFSNAPGARLMVFGELAPRRATITSIGRNASRIDGADSWNINYRLDGPSCESYPLPRDQVSVCDLETSKRGTEDDRATEAAAFAP